jgi:hypothetical protein
MTIAFVNSTRQTGSLVSSFNMTVDVGTGSDRLLVVCLMQRGAAMYDATLTYNSVSLTRASVGQYGAVLRAEVWYLANPSSGSNTLAVSYGGNTVQQYECQVSWYINAEQTAPLDDYDGTNGSSTTPSVTLVPTEDNELLVGCCIHEDVTALSTDNDLQLR